MLHRRSRRHLPADARRHASRRHPRLRRTAAGPWLRLDRLTVQGGRIEYYDSTLPKAYGIDLTDLSRVGGPGRARARPGRARGSERRPRRALTLRLTGTVDPAEATFALDVDRLLLPPLNPYLAPALGYEVKTGLARIASDVRLAGTKVAADTDLVLSRFAMRIGRHGRRRSRGSARHSPSRSRS